jgi:hypothetical protein
VNGPTAAWIVAGALLVAGACTDSEQFFSTTGDSPPTVGGGGSGGSTDGGGGSAGSTSTGTMCGKSEPAEGCDPNACSSCGNDGLCIIVCNVFDDCQGTTITCPEGLACEVQCTDDACRGATIQCPSAHACNVACTGGQSCRDATVQCAPLITDGVCELTCNGDPSVCQDATLSCGANRCTAACGEGVAAPSITCGASCQCESCGG